MSTPKVIRAAQSLLQQVSRVAHGLTKELVRWLLRGLIIIGRQPASKAGFVLPTTILLLLIVVLTVGAIGYRTFTRTQQAITERQQQVIYNAATPVIDRAKSKIEFLFDSDKDPRGTGVTPEARLLGMMLNDGKPRKGVTVEHFPADAPDVDPYTFEKETRIDLNGDGLNDNAWRYPVDLNGDGVESESDPNDGWAVYSIIFQAPPDPTTLRDSRNTGWQKRADALQVRNAPLSNASEVNSLCKRNVDEEDTAALVNGEGWFPDPTARTTIRKNFQVSAYVIPNRPNGTIATLEFQQDRQANQGFKWAAWFRNDLEIFPGPVFNWNGAMHSEGNVIIGGGNSFRGFLVSSPESCIRDKDASEITVKKNAEVGTEGSAKFIPEFKGRFITGTVRDDNFSGTPTYDLPTDAGREENVGMSADLDSINPGGLTPLDFSLEPVELQTRGISKPRNKKVTAANYEDGKWPTSRFNKNGSGRFYVNDEATAPYVDDTFRADNRWGPKPVWGGRGKTPLPIGVTQEEDNTGVAAAKIGEPITGVPELTGSDPVPGTDNSDVGLDGYWERRARVDGLRMIVGQRLELGDLAGWGGPGDNSGENTITPFSEPLLPWDGSSTEGPRSNEARQRRTLWDNLAAVQATAIYHNSTDTSTQRDFPDACLVSTVHPGTPTTLDRSATFENLAFGITPAAIPGYSDQPNPAIISDFFRGRGTNGWQYSTPKLTDFTNTSTPLMRALRNLANYAGDPNGGAPSFTPQQAGRDVHPHPSMAMWGDFSNLRQVFRLLDGGTSYDSLSPADKTTLHTAACTLGMLAYNLDYLEKFKVSEVERLNPDLMGFSSTAFATGTPSSIIVTPALLADSRYSLGLRGQIRVIDDIVGGAITEANVGSIPATQRPPLAFVTDVKRLNTDNGMNVLAWEDSRSSNPETYVRLLERWRDDATTPVTQKNTLNTSIALARLIITKEQVARDRTWGFQGVYGGAPPLNRPNALSFAPLGNCGFASADPAGNVPGWKNPVTRVTISKQDGTPVHTNLPPDPLHRFCSPRPRFPILYSLFPATPGNAPNAIAALSKTTLDAAYAGGFLPHRDISDPRERQVARDVETSGANGRYIVNENAGVTYTVVRPQDIALTPLILNRLGVGLGGARPNPGTQPTAWTLPNADGTPSTGSTPNNSNFNLIKVCGTPCSQPNSATASTTFQLPIVGSLVRVAFKDTAFYNGRELMPVRALNLDLDLMRQTPYGADVWLPKESSNKTAVVYAYREDAVSEAHIVRPTSARWEACKSDEPLQTLACTMKTHETDAYTSTDPPVNDENSITPKPVDYYPDPDRRPYGFRLIQGANISREGDEGRGLSFISDNPVYVQGNFNLHQLAGGGGLIEEFTQLLQYNGDGRYSNFYNRTTLDQSFANRNRDQWRPAEVIADAVTLLSADFCDGSIEDGLSVIGRSTLPRWLQGRYGCNQPNLTSYFNQNLPKDPITPAASALRGSTWVRTTLADNFPGVMREGATGRGPEEAESPIFIARGGKPVQWSDASGRATLYPGGYNPMNQDRNLLTARDNTRMNMIMVSGLVPSRKGQSYGGLHNFPRFNENWNGKNLYINGAFLQLNFSTYATAPFDQEAWQINAPAPTSGANNEWIRYYSPPNRRWGYDVALQYAPPGPVAERFQFTQDTRSEFYSEPPANDPYIRNLCLKAPAVPGRPAPTCPA